MMQIYDKNNDGYLTYEEARPMLDGFFSGMNKQMPDKYAACVILDKEFLEGVFRTIDKGGQNRLTQNEIEAFVRKLLLEIKVKLIADEVAKSKK